MAYNLEELFKEVKNVENKESPALISEDDTKELVKAYAQQYKTNELKAYTGICLILQKGGTSRKAQGTIYANVDGITFDLATLRKVMREKSIKYTLRQWARTNATDIYIISSKFSFPGDLTKKILRNHPEISGEDIYWLSNFQMDNFDCPENLRQLIMEHYESLFSQNSQKN
jgi:virulence-associated protein VapD